jgi:YidC/Oxa1 family membrane protein insertase
MMDRNSLIGLLLIGTILIGWLYFSAPSKEEIARRQKQQDSLLLVQKEEALKTNIKKSAQPDSNGIASINPDSASHTVLSDSMLQVIKKNNYGVFSKAADGEKNIITIENELIKVRISNLGGRISSVELKNYKTNIGLPLMLFDADSSRQALSFGSGSKGYSTDSLFFQPFGTSFNVTKNDSGSVALRLFADDQNKYIEYVYGLKGNSYEVSCNINIVGMQDIIAANTNYLTLDWQMLTPSQEKSIPNQQKASNIYYKYSEGDDVDVEKITETSQESKSLDSKIKWIAFKQQFFTSALIAENTFEKPIEVTSRTIKGSGSYVKDFSTSLTIPYDHQAKEKFNMAFYFGPNKYNILKGYGIDLEKQIPLGWGIFGWVNKFIVLPIFNFLGSSGLNYGIIILILTIIIKIILFPIAYKTYLSSAKMRVLKPEIDEIEKKLGKDADPLKKQQAKMALYKKAGINPMAGCIPLLLQMPILIALFNFFPSSIELRQAPFLWADDLSTYDSIYNLSFSIPFYGDHVSLFTLLMTISTILYTYTNSQLMSTNDQMPGMKVMMYIMPIMFLGVFNSYSAGLSYYYFLANMITFGQTFIMRRFVDEDALHRKIQENKKKPVKVSGFQARLEKMAKEQQMRAKQRKN